MIGERRKKQIESMLLQAVQKRMAKGLSDPRVRGLITVTRVDLTEDGKRAKAFITVLPAEHAELTMHGLRAATAKVRRDVMDMVHLRDMPGLEFSYDEGLKAQMEVMALLTRDKLEREAKDGADAAEPAKDGSEDQA